MTRIPRTSRAALMALLATLLLAGVAAASGCTSARPATTDATATAPRPSIDTSTPASLETATFGMG